MPSDVPVRKVDMTRCAGRCTRWRVDTTRCVWGDVLGGGWTQRGVCGVMYQEEGGHNAVCRVDVPRGGWTRGGVLERTRVKQL